MSFKALILLKNREAVIHNANAKKSHFKYGDGIYVISEANIQNVKVGDKIRGAEAIYFEGNPNAVGYRVMSDTSGDYLDDIVIINALKQTGSAPRFDFSNWFSMLAPLKNPTNLIYGFFFAVIIYGLLAQAFGWV